MVCLVGMGMQAQVYTTSSRNLPKPKTVRPQYSTDVLQKKPAKRSNVSARPAKPLSLNIPKPKLFKDRKPARVEEEDYINDYWGAAKPSMWEINAGYSYFRFDYDASSSTVGGLGIDWNRSLTGNFGTALIPYLGLGVHGGYEFEREAIFGTAGVNAGIMFGKKKFKVDLRVQPAWTYCTRYKTYHRGYYTSEYYYNNKWDYGYRDVWHDGYYESHTFSSFTMNASLGIYYNRIHIRGIYYFLGMNQGVGARLALNF